jgi:hypothetical protein
VEPAPPPTVSLVPLWHLAAEFDDLSTLRHLDEDTARSGVQGRREGDRLSSPNTMRASRTELPCDRPWQAYVRSIGRRHSGLSPESNGLRLSEALPLDLKSRLLLGRDGSMEPARDVPPKGATHCAPLADALGRTTAAKPHRVVDAGNDVHARSLRRDRKRLRAFQTTRTGEVTPLGAKHHAAAHDRRASAGRR